MIIVPVRRFYDSNGEGFAKCSTSTFDAGAHEERLPSDTDAKRLRGQARMKELHQITRAVHTSCEGSFEPVLSHNLPPRQGPLEEVDPRTAALEWVGREMERISWQITLDSRPGVVSAGPLKKKSVAVPHGGGAVQPRSAWLKRFLASRFSRIILCQGAEREALKDLNTDSSGSEHLDSEDDSEAVWGGDAIMQVGRPTLFVAKRGGCNVRSQKNLLLPCGRGPWGGEHELTTKFGIRSDPYTSRKTKSRRVLARPVVQPVVG